MNLPQIRTVIERERGKFQRLESEKEKVTKEIKQLEERQEHIEQARELIRSVAIKTQEQVKYYISDIVTLALEAVFDNPYSFETEFVLRRGKTECDLFFSRNGQQISPLDASGGGVVDICSFALRLSLWSLNKNRPVLLLDEPFKHLSRNLHGKALRMLKEVSRKLNVQIIMVSHNEEFVDEADRIIELVIEKGCTMVV